MFIRIRVPVSFKVHVIKFRNASPSDEEDDVIGHHDLVVVLHAGQSGADVGLCEAALAALVDVFHQRHHLHRLSVSGLEHGEQRRLELLQPGEGITQMSLHHTAASDRK